MIDQIKTAATIAALMGGMDSKTIEEMTGIKVTDTMDGTDAETVASAGALLHMANAAHAAGLMEQFKTQGFTREEAIPLIAAVLRK
jgi:hypothetical protein